MWEYIAIELFNKFIWEQKGWQFPILGINERALNLLSLKVVDDIILGAPKYISESFVKDFNISIVGEGMPSKNYLSKESNEYDYCKSIGIYQ